MQNAGLSRREKSMASASSQKSLKFADAAADMRRLFGSAGGAARPDILFKRDADGPLGCDRDQEARVTHKRTKKQGWVRKGGAAPPRLVGIEWKGMAGLCMGLIGESG